MKYSNEIQSELEYANKLYSIEEYCQVLLYVVVILHHSKYITISYTLSTPSHLHVLM